MAAVRHELPEREAAPASDEQHQADQHSLTEAARRLEQHHLRPVPGAVEPVPNPFPARVGRGLLVSLLAGALLGLLFAALLFENVLVPPGWEQLYSDGQLTFYVFWMFLGMAGGILFGGVGTILAAPPAGNPIPSAATLTPRPALVRVALYTAAGLLALDALMHMWISPHHVQEWGAAAGVAMMLASIVEFALAAAVLVWLSRNLVLGSLGVVAVLLLVWVFTRIWGLPFGPVAWVPLHTGPIDVVSKSAEVLLIGVLVVLYRGTPGGK